MILAGRAARTPAGLQLMVELAEALQAGVVDSRRRLNFPTRHPLERRLGRRKPTSCSRSRPATSRTSRAKRGSATRRSSASRRRISSSAATTRTSMRYAEVDMSIAADAEASLPALIEEIRRLTTGARQEAFRQRGERVAEANRAHVRAGAHRRDATAGTRAPSARRGCRWSCGRSSRTRTGRT